jgi:GNAT superfamily N-acetyltransferase
MAEPIDVEHFRALMDLELMTFHAGCRLFDAAPGRIVVHPAYALLYDANFVILRRVAADETVASLEARVRPFFAREGVPHYRFIMDPVLGQQLGSMFEVAGYRQSCYLLMELRNAPTLGGTTRVDIRRASNRKDEAALDRVETDLLQETSLNSPMMRSTLRSRRRELSRLLQLEWYVAWWGLEPAGSIGLLRSGTLGSVQAVSTRRAFRGHRVASSLVLHVLERAKAEGLTAVSLLTESDDWPQHLYVRLGFEIVGKLESWVRDLGQDEA